MLVGIAVSGCVPGATHSASSTSDARAVAAKRATARLQAAERQQLGCAHVTMSDERRATPTPEYPVFLIDAVATAEPCWDKIVFTFQPTVTDTPPGYEIEYRKPPFVEGPDNAPVDTLGTDFLWLTFKPASSTDASDPNHPLLTYRGNLRLRLADMNHTQLVRKIMDGDGTVSWLIGLDAKHPFTVDAANNPPRVIVYIAK